MNIDLFDANNKRNGLSIADRIDASGDCWLWTGYIYESGYGGVSAGGKFHYAHRLVWESLVGPIPDGLQIDHLCRVRSCVNPDHLETVTGTENRRRGYGSAPQINKAKSCCPKGHPYSGDNLYVSPRGGRACRKCGRDAHRMAYVSPQGRSDDATNHS